MADASDEQQWWSTLFADGVDPGLTIPDGMWESVVSAVFDGDAEPPDENLLPDEPPDLGTEGLDDDVDFGHHVADQPLHGSLDGGGDSGGYVDAAAEQDHHDAAHHDDHGGGAGELGDAFGEDDTGYEME